MKTRSIVGVNAALLLAVLAVGCSEGAFQSPTSPGATGGGGAPVTMSTTNAPGGIPVPVNPAGRSCPMEAPSFRVEISSAGHIDFDWGHNPAAAQVRIEYRRRDHGGAGPLVVIRELEERPGPASGNGSVLHHLERGIVEGVYDGTIAYELGGDCGGALSKASSFTVGWTKPVPVTPTWKD